MKITDSKIDRQREKEAASIFAVCKSEELIKALLSCLSVLFISPRSSWLPNTALLNTDVSALVLTMCRH